MHSYLVFVGLSNLIYWQQIIYEITYKNDIKITYKNSI